MNLVPSSLNDYIGQDRVKQNIRVCLESGKKRAFNDPLGHMLFCGPPGLGKTSLSEIIAKELFRPIRKYLGPHLKNVADLNFLKSVNYGEIVFIDEIHSLSKKIEESLYEPMDRFKWNGEDICSFASEDPASYFLNQRPKTWGHSSALFCQRMGDCGNYRNIADELTKFG